MGLNMKATRMRMTKEAAKLIHDYRDKHDIKSNADAIHDLVSDLDVANCNQVYMSKQLSELQCKNERLQRANKCLNSNLSIMKSNRECDLAISKGSIQGFEDRINLKDSRIEELQTTVFNNGKWMIAAKGKMLILSLLAFIGWGGFIAMLV